MDSTRPAARARRASAARAPTWPGLRSCASRRKSVGTQARALLRQAVNTHGVFAEDLASDVFAQTAVVVVVLLDEVVPGLGMRIVGGYHHVVRADEIDGLLDPAIIRKRDDESLAAEQVGRLEI